MDGKVPGKGASVCWRRGGGGGGGGGGVHVTYQLPASNALFDLDRRCPAAVVTLSTFSLTSPGKSSTFFRKSTLRPTAPFRSSFVTLHE